MNDDVTVGSVGASAADDANAGQSDRNGDQAGLKGDQDKLKGGHTIEGEVLSVEGDKYSSRGSVRFCNDHGKRLSSIVKTAPVLCAISGCT